MTMLKLMPATIEDAEWLYHLRNSASVRQQSGNDREIGKLEHYKWYVDTLLGGDRKINIAWLGTTRVGMVRADFIMGAEWLSWAVGEKYRGNGYAKAMLAEFTMYMREKLIARIKVDNIASIKVAESIGMSRERNIGCWDVYTREARV